MKKILSNLRHTDLHFLGLFLFIALLLLNIGVYFNLDMRLSHRLMPNIEMHKDIVVLEIGDKELQQIGQWPWQREVFAQVLSKIQESQPKALGIDIIFQEKSDQLEGNKMLISKLREDNVVVATSDSVSQQIINTNSELVETVRTGVVHYPATNNGYVYSVKSIFQNKPILPLEMIRSKTDQVKVADSFGLNTNTTLPTTISLIDYLNIPVLREKLTNKYVLLGSSSKSLGDFVSVPGFDSIPGVYLHALVLSQYLNQSFPSINSTNMTLFVLVSCGIGLLLSLNVFKKYVWWIWLEANLFFILIWLSQLRFRFSVISLLSMTGAVFATLIIKTIWDNLRDKQKFKNVLGAHLSPQVMSVTSENLDKINLGGQKYNITVLFTDLRGFTKYSEKVDPSEVGATLNHVLGYQADTILANDGVVDKFIGDSVMGFWGAPMPDPEYAYKALTTSAQIVLQFKEWKKTGQYSFDIGMALHEGPAVVGNFGSKKRFNYTSIGDTVNTASRIESLTKFYGSNVLFTSEFWQALTLQQQQNFEAIMIDVIKPRGKQKQIQIYELQRYFDGKKWLQIQPQSDGVYTQIFELYQQKQFKSAISLCKKHKSRKSKIILDRCLELLTAKNSDWDGVWAFE